MKAKNKNEFHEIKTKITLTYLEQIKKIIGINDNLELEELLKIKRQIVENENSQITKKILAAEKLYLDEFTKFTNNNKEYWDF